MIAKDAKICPQCGGRVKKSHGCLMIIILMIVIFVAAKISLPNSDVPSTSNNDAPKTENPNSPENADAFQVDYFSNDGAIIFAQNFLEKYGDNIKYTTAAKVGKIITSKSDKRTDQKTGDFWSVYQEFTEKNAFGVDLKHSYSAIIEFKSGAGYRMVMLMIDDVAVYPK
jgi:hypothetical protein